MANWKHDLQIEVQQLDALLDDRERLEVRIAKQRQKVAALEVLVASDDLDSDVPTQSTVDLGGLTDACRTVLRASGKEWMTTADIQVALRELGFDMGRYKAPHASIMTTVNRLADGENSEVIVRRNPTPGGTEYKWVGSRFSAEARKQYGAPNSLANQDARGELAQARDNFIAATRKRRIKPFPM